MVEHAVRRFRGVGVRVVGGKDNLHKGKELARIRSCYLECVLIHWLLSC